MTDTEKPLICFRTPDDGDATRAAAVLEALGYRVTREFTHGDGSVRLQWTVIRCARRYKLTTREQDILEYLVAGHSNKEISEATDLGRDTVKWHLHNIFSKTGATTRNKLLSLVFGFTTDSEPEIPQPQPLDD
jgi:DNA-binding NarL/FixJ family response regulator